MHISRSTRAASGLAAVAAATAIAAVFAPSASAAVNSPASHSASSSARPSGLIADHPIHPASSLLLSHATNSGSAQQPTAAKQLGISQQVQQQDEWCWVASSVTVEQFEGASTTQPQFCAAALGTQVGACPNQPGQISDVINGLNNTGFNGQSAGGAISYSAWQQQTNAGMPTLQGIYWTSGGGHMETGYGYDASNNSVLVGDPWPTYQRYQTFAYNDYVRNANFTWGDTVENISAA